MKRNLTAVLLGLALVAGACGDGASPESEGPRGSELPPAAACEEGTENCDDTVVFNDDDLFPGDEPHDGMGPTQGPTGGSSGFVVDGGLTVTDALETDATGVIAVKGFYLDDGTGARLCEGLAESLPPQCALASIPLGDGAIDMIDPDELEEAQGVTWTNFLVTIVGEVVDGTLVPTELSI